MLLEILVASLALFCVWFWLNTARKRNLIAKFPGPRAYPIVGSLTKMRKTSADFYDVLVTYSDEYAKDGSPFRFLLGNPSCMSVVVLNDPKDFELVLGSSSEIEKGIAYQAILPWLGSGLFTATGSKWKSRRKILIPCFHYSILDGFTSVFNENAQIFVEKLARHVDGPGFDVTNYIKPFSLDNICETAMGVKVNAQNGVESDYIKAVHQMTTIILQQTVFKPWLRIPFLFNMSKYKPLFDKSLDILHTTTGNVIKKRRAEMANEREFPKNYEAEIGLKKRLAFLDLLLGSSFDGVKLTNEEIRQEVDTFMFAGYDTIAGCLGFVLWCLSWNQDVQDQTYQELQDVFSDPSETPSIRKLSELNYMERVIKETLRLYPSAPIILRDLKEDMTLSGGLVAPKGTTMLLSVLTSQRSPNFWPDPLKFDPERFNPENCQGRNPYTFIPFSAGPRNCVGQKYAMLQMKSMLCHLLRAYRLVPGTEAANLTLGTTLTLESVGGVPVKIVNRN